MRYLSQPIFPCSMLMTIWRAVESGWLCACVFMYVPFSVHVSIDMRFLTSKPSSLLSFIIIVLFIVVVVAVIIIIIIDFYYENFTLANNTSVKMIMMSTKEKGAIAAIGKHKQTHFLYCKMYFLRLYKCSKSSRHRHSQEIMKYLLLDIRKEKHQRCSYCCLFDGNNNVGT